MAHFSTTDSFNNAGCWLFIYMFLSGILPIISTAPALDDGVLWVSVSINYCITLKSMHST